MQGEVAIRAGVEADKEWCARLMAESEPWLTLQQDLQACREKMKRPGTELFVAEAYPSGALVGFVLLAGYGFAGMPYVASIGVANQERGRGVGGALLRFAEKRFAGRGRLFLLVSSFNEGAQAFYKREGYELLGELKDCVVKGHCELILAKRLE